MDGSAEGGDLGERLVAAGMMGPGILDEVRAEARQSGTALEDALVDSGRIAEPALLDFLAEQHGIPFPEVEDSDADPDGARWLPAELARRHAAVPLGWSSGRLVVATPHAHRLGQVDELRFHVGRPVQPVFADRARVQRLQDRLYGPIEGGEDRSLERALEAVADRSGGGVGEADAESGAGADASPVVHLVNELMARAMEQGASDIHVEATESSLWVRFRVDGALHLYRELPGKLLGPVLSRIKVLGGLDISDRRRPQDGRLKMRFRGRKLDVRIATLPTFWGEKAVLRLLDQSGVGLDLASLGFLPGEQEKLEAIIHQPQGLVLATGPTGSGKTTTLYSVLRALNSQATNIITVEDPVEFQLRGINQVPVNPKAGLDFARGLRAILRQDPNVIMVGEIRDLETAEIAMEASETGHRVLSTLHTNSAIGAVTRLVDMGVPRYLVADSVSAVLAQRLVPINCPDCAEPVAVSAELRRTHRIPEQVTFYEGRGCPSCDGRGRKGRTGVYELLVADQGVRDAIHNGAPEEELLERARRNGMHRMFEDALIKAMKGQVALSDVLASVEVSDGVAASGEHLLEVADAGWEARRGSVPSPGGSGAGQGVLVASAVAEEREMAAFLLDSQGHTVQVARDGHEAREMLRDNANKLLVVDTALPPRGGGELVRGLRDLDGWSRLPVLAIVDSGLAGQAEALESGADACLPKPLHPGAFRAQVGRLLQREGTMAD
jgi:type IV pilus assembly protein PilB